MSYNVKYADMVEHKFILPVQTPGERYFLQTMRSRYKRTATVQHPDKIPYQELIGGMPTFYDSTVPETGLRIVAIENDLPWSDQDITLFALGDTNPVMLYDLSPEEIKQFFKAGKRVVDASLQQPDCLESYIGIGFNPHDTALGSHTISRLHAHVSLLDQDYLNSRQKATKTDLRDWYYRMVFCEPFTPVFHEFINHYIESFAGKEILSNIGPREIKNTDCISMTFPRTMFGEPAFNRFVSKMLLYLQRKYKKMERIFTDGKEDELSGRYILREKEEILSGLNSTLSHYQFLSEESREKLMYLARNIQPALPRTQPNKIEESGQLWASKGFGGAVMFRFKPHDDTFAFEYFPKVLATQALTRGNGVNSGANTYKDNSQIETSEYLIGKMANYVEMAKQALNGEGLEA